MKNIHTLHGFLAHSRRPLLIHTVLGAGALSLSLAAGVWFYHQQPARPQMAAKAPAAPLANPYGPVAVSLGPWARTAALTPETKVQAKVEGETDVQAKVETAPVAAAPESPQEVATAEPTVEYPTVDLPLPPRRPIELKNLASRQPAPLPAPVRQAALPPQQPAAPAAPADNRSFFEKVFGAAEQPAAAPQPQPAGRTARRQQPTQQARSQALAYAPQETGGGLFGGLNNPLAGVTAPAPQAPAVVSARPGNGTAVYDISAHTVYMPDGTRLEAHSGLREHLDDPRFVHVRMKGPTPPSVYQLSPREALFHGVEALRLTPISGSVFGRAGLLAHTYMLGPNGDSNGCVSFRDYNAFLQAYKRGDVRRLVVVARM